jgi:hypothetical protein
MSGSNKLYLGSVAQVDGSAMTIIAGKQLKVIDAPSSDTGVANKKYIDDVVKVVQDSVNLITKDSLVSFDTLLEIKTFADGIASTGATELTAAINTERAARIADVDAEEQARIAAIGAAIDDEVADRNSAIGSAISDEVAARNTAISDAVDAEEQARIAEDAKLDMLAIKSSKTMLYTPTVYYDSSSLPKPLELCTYPTVSNAGNFDGWRMRNDVALSKFSLYIPPSPGLKVGDVKAMYLELCAVSVVSMPFITIYTNKKNDGKDYVEPSLGYSWYRSRNTYINNSTDTLVAGYNYNMVANLKNVDTLNPTYFTRHDTVPSSSSKNLENMSDNDEIMFFTIDSNSTAAVGNVECIIGKFKVQLANGIYEFVFSNANVFADYMKQKQIQLWRSLFGTSSTDDPFINNYQIPAPDYSVR